MYKGPTCYDPLANKLQKLKRALRFTELYTRRTGNHSTFITHYVQTHYIHCINSEKDYYHRARGDLFCFL